jgi:hypothetical protein
LVKVSSSYRFINLNPFSAFAASTHLKRLAS